MSRGIYIPLIVLILACLAGCGSQGGEQTLPDEVVGLWKSSAKGYEDNALELRKDAILFGVGGPEVNADGIYKVEQAREPDGRTFLKLYFTDQDGNDYDTSLYFDPKGGGSIRFKNHPEVEWKLADRRPTLAAQVPPARRSRSLGISTWSIVVALLGVALTSGASFWRRSHLPPPKERRLPPAAEKPGKEPGATVGPAIVGQEQRRSERILLMIPLEVEGIDVNGASFTERTRTFSINRNGAYISLKNVPQQGDDISVTNLGTRQTCIFRLCESGKDPSGEITAWGIECLEPELNFWQIRFPEKPLEPSPQRTIAVLIVCAACRTREVADLTVPQYHAMLDRESMTRDCPDCAQPTEWKFILVESAEAGPEEAPSLPSGEESRRHKRIVAKLPIRLRHPDDRRVEDAITENVSRSGVCCAAAMALDVDQLILLTFEPGTAPDEEEIPARIKWRRPMGEGHKTLYGIRLERRSS